jgi:hypothetical protein
MKADSERTLAWLPLATSVAGIERLLTAPEIEDSHNTWLEFLVAPAERQSKSVCRTFFIANI